VSDALAALVDGAGGRIATGFLGTPLVLPALCRGGHFERAYRLLMNPECPGWLYQVQAGATTMWERWDAIRPGGKVQAGEMGGSEGMLSFNHYAYGAVAAWLYRTVAGLAPGSPGYGEIVFAPVPGGGLDHARAAIATPLGRAAIAWRGNAGALTVDLEVPPGARGRFAAPPGRWRASLGGAPAAFTGTTQARPSLDLGSGRWTLELTAEV
jgi:alpha-L-rhamnosidase